MTPVSLFYVFTIFMQASEKPRQTKKAAHSGRPNRLGFLSEFYADTDMPGCVICEIERTACIEVVDIGVHIFSKNI